MKKWIVPELDKKMVSRLQNEYGLPMITAMLLTLRGITDVEKIQEFFSQEVCLDDPLLIKDMDKAVERIRHAVKYNEKICVFGDYDCDGVTSTAILYSYLQGVYADVIYYIPDRNAEGYGLNKAAISKLNDKHVKLMITVDNGISAYDEVEYANELGIDVVITDHHAPPAILPKAVAIVNPHRSDETYSFIDYSGAGIALKLACAIEGSDELVLENYCDLAALGTVADIVPLRGENRKIVSLGINSLNNTERTGLFHLFEKSGITEISAGIIGFRIAPRLNAAGRLKSPYDALDLLLTESDEFAEKKSEMLNELNARRQDIESQIAEDIISGLDADAALTYDKIIVASSPNWNAGVIGIVSARITERYGKPSILISEGEEICRASGRSIPGFSIIDAITACSGYLDKFGGHPMAAGLSIKKENIADFRKAINEYADRQGYLPAVPLKLECNLVPTFINPEMIVRISDFEPFGYGNPKPVFGLKNMKLNKITPIGNGKHLRLSFSRDKAYFTMLLFSCMPSEFPFLEGDILDVAVNLDVNQYNGNAESKFTIKDIKPAGYDCENDYFELQDYEMYKKGKIPVSIYNKYPERADFESVYKYIRARKQPVFSISGICSALDGIGTFKLLMILDILSEIEVLKYKRENDILHIELLNVKVKSSLDVSYTYKKLREDVNNARKDKILPGL